METKHPGSAKKATWNVWIVMIVLVVLSRFVQVLLQYLPSPLAQEMAADLSVSFVSIGLLLSACTVASGFSPWVAALVTDRAGALIAWSVGILFSGLGGLGSTLVQRYEFLILMYVFQGVGVGFSICLMPVLIGQWVPARFRSFGMSMMIMSHNLFVSAAYVTPAYLVGPVGSWQKLMLLYALSEIVFVALLLLFHRRGKGRTADPEPEPEKKPRPSGNSGILRAAKHPTVLLLTLIMAGFIWSNNTTSSYFPTYLMQQFSLDSQQAGTITSVISITATVGAFAAGFFSEKLRRFALRMFPIAIAAGGFGMYAMQGTAAISFFAGLFGLAYQGWIPVALAHLMSELSDDPTALAGATAMFNGVGHILTLLIPFSVDLLLRQHALRQSMLWMQLPLLLSVALALLSNKLLPVKKPETP